MSDNATAHASSAYEREVTKTIPFHDEILNTAIDVALAVNPSPRRWFDTGTGPGTLIERAMLRAPNALFHAADPSSAMLELARARLPIPAERFFQVGSQDLPDMEPFDVITAVQCHHYGDMDARTKAVARCHRSLVEGGVLVVFENVRAETDEGHAWQRARWAAWQRAQGRDEATVAKHLAREGTAFFPIRPSEHVELLGRIGFRVVEMVWRAYGQAGFVAVR
jgi:tRNA (cmo5U34)-methyltransferase